MRCVSEFTWAQYADGELPAEEAARLAAHLGECAGCQTLLTALQEENRVLIGALAADVAAAPALAEAAAAGPAPAAAPAPVGAPAPVAAPDAVVVPAPAAAPDAVAAPAPAVPPAPATGAAWPVVAWTGAAALVLALVSRGAGGPGRGADGLDWLGVLAEAVLFVVLNAESLGRLLAILATGTMLALGVAGAVFFLRSSGRRALAGLALAGALALAAPAAALETRAGGRVTVPAGERIEGTLVVSADTVEIAGTVDGDLIVAARVVELRGVVRGDLLAAAGTATLDGTVDGHVYAFAGLLEIRGHVTRSAYGLDRLTRLAAGGRIDGDLAVVGHGLDVAGTVGRGVWLFGAVLRVAGEVGRDVVVRGHELRLLAPARVGGDLTAHVVSADDVRVEPGATIGGRRRIHLAPPGSAVWAEPTFYLGVGVQLFGAGLLGVLGLLLVPGFAGRSVEAVGAFWRSLGLGLAVLVGAPLALLVLAVTLVGLPLALIGAGLYLLGLYVAKLVVGTFLGRALVPARGADGRAPVAALLVGLLVLTVAFEVPLFGPALRVVVWCLGLGALATAARRALARA
jgi:cytoskeletal protein CcmA (bactofilin family)